jgi:hypothetical protein
VATIVWGVGDACKDIAQIVFWVDAVELGGFDERVYGRGSLPAAAASDSLPPPLVEVERARVAI